MFRLLFQPTELDDLHFVKDSSLYYAIMKSDLQLPLAISMLYVTFFCVDYYHFMELHSLLNESLSQFTEFSVGLWSFPLGLSYLHCYISWHSL